MLNRPVQNWLEGVAAATLVLFPLVGSGFLILYGAIFRKERPGLTWLVPWAGLLLLGTVVLLRGDSEEPLLQATVGVLAGVCLVVVRRRSFLVGIMAGLLIVLVIGFAERERSRILWGDAGSPHRTVDIAAGISALSGDSPGWRRNGIRLIEKRWLLEAGTRQLDLSFEIRSVGGVSGWQWYTNSADTNQTRLSENGTPFTRITQLEGYIVRRARTAVPLGGRKVRASLELRAAAPILIEGCGLGLRTFEPSFSACEPLQVNTTWQAYSIITQFPADAPQQAFELTIAGLNLDHLDIRAVEIEILQDNAWRPLSPLEPEGVQVRFPVPDVHIFSQPTLNIIPTQGWEHHTLSFEASGLETLREITGLLQLEAGTQVELRNVSLHTITPEKSQPIARPKARSSLWFEQANLAGHTFATLGLIALILVLKAGFALTGISVLLVAMGGVFITGSRTAWLGLLLGGGWLLWLRSKARMRVALVLMTIATALTIASSGGFEALGRLQIWNAVDGNNVTRTEIWETAWNTWMEHPLLGKGHRSFSEAWIAQHPESPREIPTHAHNLWLEFAASYGLLGLAAILWFTGSILWFAWRWGKWRGLALAVPVFLMNFFDYTIFYAGVLYPFILGLNMIRARSESTARLHEMRKQ